MHAIETDVIPFARTADGDLHLHVYRPRGTLPRAALLDIHGGAWTFFDHRVDFYWCEALAARGYLTASVEFRLAPRHPWPTFLCDIRAASRFLRAHAERFGLTERRIGAIGGSTGGHLATLLALWPSEPRQQVTEAIDTPDDADGHVDFAIPLWPILDVSGRYRMVTEARFDPVARRFAQRVARKSRERRPPAGDPSERMQRLADLRRRSPWLGSLVSGSVQLASALGGSFPPTRAVLYDTLARAHEGAFRNVAEMEEASPLHLLRRGGAQHHPPLLIVQGSRDTNMTLAMTQDFVDEYRRQGGQVEFVFEAGLGHSYGNIPSDAADALIDRIDRFVAAQLG